MRSWTNNKTSAKFATSTAIIVLALSGMATGAQAYGQKQIDQERAAEATRIEQGRYSGELTRREYRDLQAEQRAIKEMEARALSDGHISKREYRQIHAAQHSASRHIYQQTHDGQVSWYRRWLYNHR